MKQKISTETTISDNVAVISAGDENSAFANLTASLAENT